MSKQDLIKKAAQLAYDEDKNQVVGKDQSGEWVIRSIEDPESDVLTESIIVDSAGE